MRGDKILIEKHHEFVARGIVAHLHQEIVACPRRYTITVAGESGSGKSETGEALRGAFAEVEISAVVLQQDDYYVLPPRFNDAARRANFSWVGPSEVRLDLLDEHLGAAHRGDTELEKPLVIYNENRIDSERISLEGVKVVIAEGVYTLRCTHSDCRVFIARNRLETLEHRMKRGREDFDPFIEDVLKLEHEVISEHRSLADIVITKDYELEFVRK